MQLPLTTTFVFPSIAAVNKSRPRFPINDVESKLMIYRVTYDKPIVRLTQPLIQL